MSLHHPENVPEDANKQSFWMPGNYQRTVKRTEDSFQSCNDIAMCFLERARVERLYAQQLNEWSNKWKPIADASPLYGSLLKAWQCFLSSAERLSSLHASICHSLVSEEGDRIRTWQKETFQKKMFGGFKESHDFETGFARAQKPWTKHLKKLEKAKVAYHKASRKEHMVQEREAQAQGNPDYPIGKQRKIQDERDLAHQETQKVRARYEKVLEEVTRYTPRYREEMESIFDQSQEEERKRISFLKQAFLSIHRYLDVTNNESVKAVYNELHNTLMAIDEQEDLRYWKNTHGPGMATDWPQFQEWVPGQKHKKGKKELEPKAVVMEQGTMAVIYTVEVYSTTVLTTESISIKLFGTKGETNRQVLSTFSFTKQECRETKMSWPESVGDVFMVELEATASFWAVVLKDWFCSKVVIITPEGDQIQFPCHQYLDSKNPVVRLPSNKAFICVPRTRDKLNPALLFQRQEEIKKRQQDYRWKVYDPELPGIIDAASPSDLPKEVQFSFTKEFDMLYNLASAIVELKIETFTHCHESWNNLDELRPLMEKHHNEITDFVSNHWDEDEFFGNQLLNGLNPMMIERCTELPPNFPVTEEMVQFAFPQSSLTEEMKDKNIFICDYKRLSGLSGNVINNEQQFVTSPLCLLFNSNGNLIPIAIQLHQEPGETNPIFLANEPNEWDWTLAKTFVRGAEFFEHELNFHLLRAHLMAEVFTISTMRNLPSSHPLFKLLLPHTHYTLQINILARNRLISSDGVFTKYTALGPDAIVKFLQRAASSLTYSSLCLPDNIRERGLENILKFHYREDGMKLWEIIQTFVDGLLRTYYKSDEDVNGDCELQNWISDIFNHGFRGNENTGIPSSFSNLDQLIKFVTMVIFTVSAQHSALNNSQFDFGAWMPNFPSSLRQPPPSEKGKATKESFLQTLPTVHVTAHGLAILYVLSTKSSDHCPLGQYTLELFGDEEALQHINKFQQELKILNPEVKVRNDTTDLPYLYIKPMNVDNSVAI